MEKKEYRAIFFAILAAALYAISSPVAKLLLKEVPPTLMASFLYFGAGLGMLVVDIIKKKNIKEKLRLDLQNKNSLILLGWLH